MHFETTANPAIMFVESTQDTGKGYFYRLNLERGTWRCTCPGFKFRRQCKHAFEANAIFGGPKPPAPVACCPHHEVRHTDAEDVCLYDYRAWSQLPERARNGGGCIDCPCPVKRPDYVAPAPCARSLYAA